MFTMITGNNGMESPFKLSGLFAVNPRDRLLLRSLRSGRLSDAPPTR
jgi:hypothetical protein